MDRQLRAGNYSAIMIFVFEEMWVGEITVVSHLMQMLRKLKRTQLHRFYTSLIFFRFILLLHVCEAYSNNDKVDPSGTLNVTFSDPYMYSFYLMQERITTAVEGVVQDLLEN